MTRRQLDDAEWMLIEPLLPIGRFGLYPQRLRDQFEEVIWRFRAGAQWREMPCEFGPFMWNLICQARARAGCTVSET